ncbi:hypothetical protein, partial [Helicobacter pylori]|uniref:hypothetical protein n=1 Tax=Helicobacter pylori TaxID=210 RepID=UPI0029290CB0
MTVLIRSGATDLNVINVLYENIFDQGAVTYSSAADGFAGFNVQDEATWNTWKPSASSSFVSVSLATAKMCNTLGIA